MTTPNHEALPVELVGEPIELSAPESRTQQLTIAGVLLALLVCLVGVILLALQGGEVPAVLEGATYALVGALAGMLTQRR